jgi:hypothetical protein
MISLIALAGDLSCRFAAVNAWAEPVNSPLTMNLQEKLTTKIKRQLTINVPSSFAFKSESVTRAA